MRIQLTGDSQPSIGSSSSSSTLDHDSRKPVPRVAGTIQSKLTKALSHRLLRTFVRQIGNPNLVIELPNGEEILPVDAQPTQIGRIRFVDDRAVWRVILDPTFQLGEMYVAGRVIIEGQIEDVMTEILSAMQRAGNRTSLLSRLFSWVHWPRGTSLKTARKNIYHHYDVGNDFYSLWLDEQLAYTCAYFKHPEMTLGEAQVAKFDHVCRKVQLRPNMQVIEAGCGWGGLALHMARNYGVRVQAYNISREQIQFARKRARTEGLEHRVEFIEKDWRELGGTCDAFVSVGMLEHVGLKNYQLLGKTIKQCLRPGGHGIVHSIGQNSPVRFNPWMEKRIFPGAYPPALSEFLGIFEPNGLSVLDVENLRLHYAQTLQHWLDRFRLHEPTVRQMYDETFVRTWRFYLGSVLAAFAAGNHQLFQVVFNHATDNNIPPTRDYLYRTEVDQVQL
ncbi:MAG: cyclopropane-fatty-acyl-phospholipid synthase family protein [Pirellulaceae bacterium]